jgi:hypothetical protein
MDMPDGTFPLIEVLLWFAVIAAVAALGIYVTLKLFPREKSEQTGRAAEGPLGPTEEGQDTVSPGKEPMSGTTADRGPTADGKGGDRGRKAA